MNQDEVESQLSAMFDGELPAAECELLSRRIDRDENLRSRWGRYALIGAAMRSEPVATARSGFAGRVSAAIEANSRPRRLRRSSRMLWNGALAASLVAGVAGIGVSMLRSAALAPGTEAVTVAASPAVAASPTVAAPMPASLSEFQAQPQILPVSMSPQQPGSYVTPAGSRAGAAGLRTELADYIVAHSIVSGPLMRRNVQSELVTGEDQAGMAIGPATTDAAQPSVTGGGNGRSIGSGSHH